MRVDGFPGVRGTVLRFSLFLSATLLPGGCSRSTPPSSPTGTWVGAGQTFVLCPNGSMKVMDQSGSALWCTGTHSSNGSIATECVASSPGGVHTAVGTCSLDQETLTCPYAVGGARYSFVGKRSPIDRCSD